MPLDIQTIFNLSKVLSKEKLNWRRRYRYNVPISRLGDDVPVRDT